MYIIINEFYNNDVQLGYMNVYKKLELKILPVLFFMTQLCSNTVITLFNTKSCKKLSTENNYEKQFHDIYSTLHKYIACTCIVKHNYTPVSVVPK